MNKILNNIKSKIEKLKELHAEQAMILIEIQNMINNWKEYERIETDNKIINEKIKDLFIDYFKCN